MTRIAGALPDLNVLIYHGTTARQIHLVVPQFMGVRPSNTVLTAFDEELSYLPGIVTQRNSRARVRPRG